MLGKILLTATIILVAFAILRQRSQAEARSRAAGPGDRARAAADRERSRDLRVGAWLFLLLMVGIGGGLYYSRWQDDHTVLTVTLHSAGSSEPISYEVYKYQLGQRSFTTIEGTTITVASSERMEVEGLND